MEDQIQNCYVCNETQYTLRDGFYYCNECGTQAEHIRHIEIDEDPFQSNLHRKVAVKIKSTKPGKSLLTSWECFNYLLCGLVDELINLGAKEELKIKTLQLWAAYLKKHEIAFFSKKSLELPKLGPRHLLRDQMVIYNRDAPKKTTKRKLNQSKTLKLRNQTRKQARKDYEILSASLADASIITTIGTEDSSNASKCTIPLQFTNDARKYYKKFMSSAHLKKHENDHKNELTCHTLYANKSLGKVCKSERLSRKTVYTLLYLALNLIEDNIQLADLLRFMREGHLSTENINHFFPEEVVDSSISIINGKSSYGKTFYNSHNIRQNSINLCRFLDISYLKLPNLCRLVDRYIQDLNLPKKFITFIKRLIRLYSPEMKLKYEHLETPCYEGRAMAYIIFTLKLFFGLDGVKENEISESALKVNELLLKLEGGKESLLFVWKNWVRFIEMRQIILTQIHLPTAQQHNQIYDIKSTVEHIKSKYETQNEKLKPTRKYISNMQNIFEELSNILQQNTVKDDFKFLLFPPSLKSQASKLNYILSKDPVDCNIFIPDFMRESHAKLNIGSFINPNKLQRFFNHYSIKLVVEKKACNPNQNLVGYFKNFEDTENKRLSSDVRVRYVNFNIDEETWVESVSGRFREQNIIFSALKNNNNKRIYESIKKSKEINNASCENKSNMDYITLPSFEIFKEGDMNPLEESILLEPRRNLEETNNLLIDNENHNEDVEENNINDSSTVNLTISNMDCWTLFGSIKNLRIEHFEEIESNFPPIFLWLLKTCANIIEVDVKTLYQELMIIENLFFNVIPESKNSLNILNFKPSFDDKYLNNIIKMYKPYW